MPSKAPPLVEAGDEEPDEDVDESDAEFCFTPPHATPNDVIRRSEKREIALEDWGMNLMRETANRIIRHPFLIGKNGEASERVW
jgi:hypothetical protein